VFHYLPDHINKASDQITNQSSSNCAAAAAAPANHHIGTVGSKSQLNACELTKLLMTLKSSRWGGTGYAGVGPSLSTCWFEHSFEILLFYWPEHQEIKMNARFVKVLSVPLGRPTGHLARSLSLSWKDVWDGSNTPILLANALARTMNILPSGLISYFLSTEILSEMLKMVKDLSDGSNTGILIMMLSAHEGAKTT
jgi:hypothetical protein